MSSLSSSATHFDIIPAMHWDIFCQVVDNYGDIGVSWRLARQLAEEHGLTIQLWVDDLALAEKFARDGHLHVQLKHWNALADFSVAAPVVIETFSCGLPERYQQAMSSHTVWLNVDYLSAEPWVEGFHRRPSPQANGLVRHFFYPGFSEQTGGLLRESFLPALRQHAEQSPQQAWQQLGLDYSPDAMNLSLFCYAHAPVKSLLQSLALSSQASRLIVPGSLAVFVSEALGVTLTAGQTLQHQACQIIVIPFLSQIDYDLLLALCDVNFVRGEDSWIRAIWAGKPMVWLPYLQSENTHLDKLDAFLKQYLALAEVEVRTAVEAVTQAWAGGTWSDQDWQAFINNRDNITQYARAYASRLADHADLATNIVIFIEKLLANQV